MKIQPRGPQDSQIERAEQLALAERLGLASSAKQSGKTQSQVGLDRLEVSNLAETASRILNQTGAERSQRVEGLAQQYESGQLNVDPAKLGDAIINEDQTIHPVDGNGN